MVYSISRRQNRDFFIFWKIFWEEILKTGVLLNNSDRQKLLCFVHKNVPKALQI